MSADQNLVFWLGEGRDGRGGTLAQRRQRLCSRLYTKALDVHPGGLVLDHHPHYLGPSVSYRLGHDYLG